MKDTINKVQFSLFSLLSILVLKRLKCKDYVTFTFIYAYGFLELRGLCINNLHGGLFEIFVIFPYKIANMAITDYNYNGRKSKCSNVNC